MRDLCWQQVRNHNGPLLAQRDNAEHGPAVEQYLLALVFAQTMDASGP
jgi:hypothetical protein